MLRRRIHVRENLERVARPGQKVEWRFGPPKNHQPRHVAIPTHLAEALNDHLVSYPGEADGFVFTTSTGKHLTPAYFSNHILKPALEGADLPAGLRTHDLRHTATAAMIRANPNPELIKRQLGHQSIMVAYDQYGHLFPDEVDRLADALDEVWSDSDVAQIWPAPESRVIPLHSK